MKKVCHITSGHEALDDRIYLKECITLAQAGYEVYIVARGKSMDTEGIHIIGCGEPGGRMKRMLLFSNKIYKKALTLNCDVYHFHDPELLPYGYKLCKKGKIVIFDSHEDVSAQILDKHWIPLPFRTLISKLYKWYETHVVRQLSAVITATPHIAEEFNNRARKVEVVNNYPKLDDITYRPTNFADRENYACYAGGLSDERGESMMIDAAKRSCGKLLLAGPSGRFKSPLENKRTEIDTNIFYYGSVSRKMVNEIYGMSRVGLLLYQPAQNHFEAQPIKLYEYMAAGLPVIASNFPFWEKIVSESSCGICVDPMNAEEVSATLDYIFTHKDIADKMGQSGYKVVQEKYNWNNEGKKLLLLYKNL